MPEAIESSRYFEDTVSFNNLGQGQDQYPMHNPKAGCEAD